MRLLSLVLNSFIQAGTFIYSKKNNEIFKKICINIQNLSPTSVCTNEVIIPSNQIIHCWGQPLPYEPISFKNLTSSSNIPYSEGQLDVYANKKGPFIFTKKAIEKCPGKKFCDPQETEKFRKQKWNVFFGTPCNKILMWYLNKKAKKNVWA